MELKEMSLTELKALAYDLIVRLEMVQNHLRTVNQEIASRPIQVPVEPVKEAKN